MRAVTSDMICDYRDEARKLPKSMPRAGRALAFRERLAKHADSDVERVSPATVKKRIGAVQALLNFAHGERWIAENAGVRIKITGYSRTSNTRRGSRDGELAALLATPLFTDPKSWADGKAVVSRLNITSVCSGSLILGAAGLLNGYKATSHWSCRDALAGFGATPTDARVVRDRNRVTGAGVTSGLDFGLTMVAELRDRTYAECTQLMSEYDPHSPFNAGSPRTAPPGAMQPMQQLTAGFRAEPQALAAAYRERA